jgi:NTE family protein
MRVRANWHASNARAGRHDTSLFQQALGRSEISNIAAAASDPISATHADAMWRPNLPDGNWPANLLITSVNAGTGDVRLWSAEDDIPLPVAVACSTAAPGIAPPVAVGDAVWVDGAVRSNANADLILDMRVGDTHDGAVLILLPRSGSNVEREKAVLVEHGYSVHVVTADTFYSSPADLLDADFIDRAVAAGIHQAGTVRAELEAWLSN